MKKTFQFFPTPREVGQFLCELAELDENSFVLEPSIGRGDLADVAWESGIRRLYGVDLNHEMRKYLVGKPYPYITGVDFHTFAQQVFDGKINRVFNRVVMNPPFCRQQDIDHIQKAYDVLNPGGILVSVMSVSPFFRTNQKSVDFRNWLGNLNSQVMDIGEGQFKASGTDIRTKVIKIVKEAA
jgi:predicted RNA methylase